MTITGALITGCFAAVLWAGRTKDDTKEAKRADERAGSARLKALFERHNLTQEQAQLLLKDWEHPRVVTTNQVADALEEALVRQKMRY